MDRIEKVILPNGKECDISLIKKGYEMALAQLYNELENNHKAADIPTLFDGSNCFM